MLDAVLDAVLSEAEAAVEEYPARATTTWRWPTMVDRRVPGRPETFVSSAEVKAAQMKVRRLLARGEAPSAVLLAIASAGGDFRPDSPARTA